MARMNVFNICTVILSIYCVHAATDPFVIRDSKQDVIMVFTSVNLTVLKKEGNAVVSTGFVSATHNIVRNETHGLDIVLTFPKGTPSGDLAVDTFDLSMGFTKGMTGYWTMSQASANLKGSASTSPFNFANIALMSEIDLTAPEDLSFHCSRFGPLYPSKHDGNHTFYIDMRGFQVQAFANSTAFLDAYECVGFFSIGILTGLFVTLILISILTWGLGMIMSVKTMDRFDDPKAKPVSFGGTE